MVAGEAIIGFKSEGMRTMDSNYESTTDGQAWLRALQSNRLAYPNEFVVRWLARIRRELPQDCDALEMGFGSGQHLKLFMNYGLRAWGTELLDHAMDLGKQVLRGSPLAGKLIKGNLDHPDLPQRRFGAFLSWGCLFLVPKDQMRESLQRIAGLLQPGGRALFNLRTPDNWFYGLGVEGPAKHWLLDERAGPYAGGRYTFLDEQDVRSLIEGSDFEIENLERTDWWKNGLSERHSWWVVQTIRK